MIDVNKKLLQAAKSALGYVAMYEEGDKLPITNALKDAIQACEYNAEQSRNRRDWDTLADNVGQLAYAQAPTGYTVWAIYPTLRQIRGTLAKWGSVNDLLMAVNDNHGNIVGYAAAFKREEEKS